MHSSGFFQIKLIARLILKCEISGSHTISDQSLLLSTIVLNDDEFTAVMIVLVYLDIVCSYTVKMGSYGSSLKVVTVH